MRNVLIVGTLVAVLMVACQQAPVAPEPPGITAESQLVEAFGPLAQLVGTRWKEVRPVGIAKMSEWSSDLGGTAIVKRSVNMTGGVASLTYFQIDGSGQVTDAIIIYSKGIRFIERPVTFDEKGGWAVRESLGAIGEADIRTRDHVSGDGTMLVESQARRREGWKTFGAMKMVQTDDLMPEAASGAPDAGFGPLSALAGTRWRGEPGEADKAHGQPADYSDWYWDLGGTVLVNRHVLTDGSYGGVTYIQKSRKPGVLDYVYITSAGFRTFGSFTLNTDGSWTAEEDVHGMPHILKVRSTGRIGEDGVLTSVSEFLGDDGEWDPGHTFRYTRTEEPLPALAPSGRAPE